MKSDSEGGAEWKKENKADDAESFVRWRRGAERLHILA